MPVPLGRFWIALKASNGPRPWRLPNRRSIPSLAAVVMLSLASGWATLHSPTIFFDVQLLLSGSFGVFALLEFGWLGLPVGMVTALGTVVLWGHPWAGLVLALQLVWQQLFLERFNGGLPQRGNGRIVLATIAFWLLLGLPLKTLLYVGLLQSDLTSASVLGFKEVVVGVVNASLGLLLYLGLRLRQLWHRHGGDLSLRGLTFCTLLLLISLPGVLIVAAMGQQITDQAVNQIRFSLEQQAQVISDALPTSLSLRQRFPGLQVEAIATDGQVLSSDADLFSRLQRHYGPGRNSPLEQPGLLLMVQDGCPTVFQCNLQGYWRYVFKPTAPADGAWRQVTLVQPAQQSIEQLIRAMRPSLLILGLLLIAAALISEALTSLLVSQFNRILSPLLLLEAVPSDQLALGMPKLRRTGIRELNQMVTLINEQSRRFNVLARQMRRSEQQHRLLADNALDVITICDPAGRPTYISPSIAKVRGWTVAEALALPMEQQLKPEGCAVVRQALEQTQVAVRERLPLPSFRMELQQSHRNGSWIWTDVTSSCMVDPNGRYIGTLLVYRDITDRKRLEQELHRRATIDHLTGLLNRRELLEQLEWLSGRTGHRRHGEGLAVLFCDLDLFKDINDSLGHNAGDMVLRTVAERILHSIRHSDLAGRLGGDEMVVVLDSVPDLNAAAVIAQKIRGAIAEPITTAELHASITASIGVTVARPEEGMDALMARADIAMYKAKQAGRNQVILIE